LGKQEKGSIETAASIITLKGGIYTQWRKRNTFTTKGF